MLAVTNSCGCYTSTYLSLNGTHLIDDPGTPPVSTYSVAVSLTAGHTYTLSISGDSSQLLWGTPSALAPGIAAAVTAAKSASVAVVVVSDDTESEATDRPSLNLPSAQDELISAVAAANPHTVVVINAGAPVAMPWLSQVAGVVDAWYPGQTNGTSLASVLFGQTDPGGHLPVTFPVVAEPGAGLAPRPSSRGTAPTCCTPRASTWATAGMTRRTSRRCSRSGSGCRTRSSRFSGLSVSRALRSMARRMCGCPAVITNTGKTSGSDVAQLYLGDPSATGEPPRQLEGFQRVSLAPGASARVSFVITPQDDVVVERCGERVDADRRRVPASTWATPPRWPTCRCGARSA